MKLRSLLLILIMVILPACGGGGSAESTEPEAEVAVESADESEAVAEEADPATEAEPVEEAAEPTQTPTEESVEAAPPTEEAETEAAAVEVEIDDENLTATESGLRYEITEEAGGELPETGDVVAVHYRGTLPDGTVFDSSYDRGDPIRFALGAGQVIPGWDEGIALLTVGSKARLVIPPELAYGERGAGGVIPPNATLIFEVELVDILPGPPDAPTEVAEADFTTTDSGLKYYDFEEGTGDTPETGQVVEVHYTGWLEDGTMFDSSLIRGQPFSFPLDTGRVIPGWDEGVASMKVGGKRQLVIPADLAYGEQGAGGVIPPDATLIFEVELVGVQE